MLSLVVVVVPQDWFEQPKLPNDKEHDYGQAEKYRPPDRAGKASQHSPHKREERRTQP